MLLFIFRLLFSILKGRLSKSGLGSIDAFKSILFLSLGNDPLMLWFQNLLVYYLLYLNN